jgi:hypothetical protein
MPRPVKTRIIRSDRLYIVKDNSYTRYAPGFYTFLSDNRSKIEHFRAKNLTNATDISAYKSFKEAITAKFSLGLVETPDGKNSDNLDTLLDSYLNSDDFEERDVKGRFIDDVEGAKRHSCLVGQVLFDAIREIKNLDQYLSIDNNTGAVKGWSIGAHVYDRLFASNLFKLSKPAFFTTSYLPRRSREAFSGFMVGPIFTTMLGGIAFATIIGALQPWLLLGVCCIPAVTYLIQGLKCIMNACNSALCGGDLLAIKLNLQRALSCFAIALLSPVVWPLTFPIELVRFITRSVSTAVYAIKSCAESIAINQLDRNLNNLAMII